MRGSQSQVVFMNNPVVYQAEVFNVKLTIWSNSETRLAALDDGIEGDW